MRWMWIDRIVSLEKGKRLVALKNVSMAEEHLHSHIAGVPIMPASLIVEGMAQAAGILVGHAEDFREKVILFSQAGALPGSALEQVITQGKALDMATVHKEIAEREAGAQKQA